MRRIINTDTQPTTTLDLGEGDFVVVKAKLSLGDREAINEGIVVGMDRSGTQTVTTAMVNSMTLGRAITAWGGEGFCEHDDHPHDGACVPVAVTLENILKMDDGTARFIIERVDAMNPLPVAPEPVATNGRKPKH